MPIKESPKIIEDHVNNYENGHYVLAAFGNVSGSQQRTYRLQPKSLKKKKNY